jgi:ATP-binding cassette subfamily B protein
MPRSRDPELPPTFSAMWRSLRFAYRAEPRLLVVSFVLVVMAFFPDALGALWLKLLADGVTKHRWALVRTATLGLAFSGAGAWLLTIVGNRVEFLFRERATIAIEAHVVRLQASVSSVEHHERPQYLDRLQILRDHAFLLNHMYHSLMSTVGSLARLAITIALLVSVHPALVALGMFAVPTVLLSSWRASVGRRTEERAAPNLRLARHALELGTTAGPGKEVRVGGIGDALVRRRRRAWDAWFEAVRATRWATAAWMVAAWALFGASYVGAIVFVAAVMHAGVGSVLLVLAAGGRLSQYIGMTVGQAEFLRWTLDACRTLCWLEDYAASRRGTSDRAAPAHLKHGIRVEDVSFQYPGTDAWVLRDVNLELPAGSVVAIVGENGAGKTTLVKLLCKLYEPTLGRILVDDTELSRISADEWRARLAGAFQDFFRYEFLARQAIGLGDLSRIDDMPALETAVARAGAGDVVDRLRDGLDTQLGPTWDGGVDLSFGQWQKLALARGLMRDAPLLCVLDEPTAALDAETEHALFERFAAQSRTSRESGLVTVLVSHRFSTVRMADLIVVIDGARVGECGSHEQLMTRDGLYAELYRIQARAYS